MAILLDLLKFLWPFIKESVFKNQTFREFVKQNRTSVILLNLMVLMLISQTYLYKAALYNQHQAAQIHRAYNELNIKYVTERQKHELLQADRQGDRLRITELEKQVLELGERVDLKRSKIHRYETWLINCGIDPNYEGSRLPQCRASTNRGPARRSNTPARSPTKPLPNIILPEEKTEPKPGFFGRIRNIFRRDEEADAHE